MHRNHRRRLFLNIVMCISMVQTQEDLRKDHCFWILGPIFERTWLRTTKQCYIINFKQLSREFLTGKILKYIWLWNAKSPHTSSAGRVWTLGHHSNTFGWGPQNNACQAKDKHLSCLDYEKDFLYIFCLWFKPKTLRSRAIFDPGSSFEPTWYRTTR